MKRWLWLLLLLVPCLSHAQIKADQLGLHICCGSSINTSWPTIATAPTSSSFSTNPSASAGAILRFWNNGCRWTDIASSSGVNTPNAGNFGTCDTEVTNARTNHAAIYYTPGNTPSWACSAGSGCASDAMPTDANFQNYIKAVRDRVPASLKLTLTSCSQSGTTLTCTANATINQTTGLAPGNRVIICGTSQSTFNSCDANGYDTQGFTAAAVSGTQFTVTMGSSATLSSTGGTAGRPYGCSTADGTDTGCFSYFSGMNEPNHQGCATNGTSGFWCYIPNLIHLYALERPLIRAYDTNVKLFGPESAGFNNTAYTETSPCPTTGGLGYGSSSYSGGYVCEFLTTNGSGTGEGTGASYIDGISDHYYPGSSTLSTMVEANATTHQDRMWSAATAAGITLCPRGQTSANGCTELANTEYDWGTSGTTPRINSSNDNTPGNNANGVCPNSDDYLASGCWMNDQAAFLIKSIVLGLDGADSSINGADSFVNSANVTTRFIWYKWADNDYYGGLYCQQSGTGSLDTWNDCATSTAYPSGPFQKPAASAFGTAYSWLVGLTPSGHCSATNGVNSCPFTGANGYTALVIWDSFITSSASAATFNTAGYTQYRDMFGHLVAPVPASLQVGYSPLLLENLGSNTPKGITINGTVTINGTCVIQ